MVNSATNNNPGVAPIALFVYNRPAHTRLTVEALQKNDLSKVSDLIVYSDAPGTAAQAEAVRKVREYISQIDGFKSVTIIERETNFGLAHSIIDGVSRLCEKYGRVIVLEDDLVTSPYFLRFMNDTLNMYKDVDQVMHVSGSTYPIETMEDETYFLRIPLCWGWATWDRAWRHFRKDNEIMSKFDRNMRKDFTFNGSYHSWRQLKSNKNGLINTWFVYWYAALFLRNGLALLPGKSLVKNIGMDGSGVHCGITPGYDNEPKASMIQILPLPIMESKQAAILHERFFRSEYPQPPLYIRAIRKAGREIGRLVNLFRSGRR
jgi:hypothetical protein